MPGGSNVVSFYFKFVLCSKFFLPQARQGAEGNVMEICINTLMASWHFPDSWLPGISWPPGIPAPRPLTLPPPAVFRPARFRRPARA